MEEHALDDELGYEPPDGDDLEPMPLDDADQANRMMRRLRASERDAGEVREIAAVEIAQVQAWRDKRLESIGRTISWAQRSLEGWIRAVHAKSGRQSVKLPAGTVALRKSQIRYDIPTLETKADADAWIALGATVELDAPQIVTAKWSLLKRAATPLIEPGPSLGPVDPDGYEPRQGMTAAGEPLAGVVVHVPTRLAFGAKPAASIEDLDEELDEADDAVRLG